MKRRKQHHVWKAYLRAWAAKEKIWVLQDGRVRSADIEDVAVQRYFYKLNSLTAADEEFVRTNWIAPLPPTSRRANEQYLFMFSAWSKARAQMTDADVAINPELAQFLDEQIINAEENFHSGVETRAAPLIESARKGSTEFYADPDQAMLFAHFLALQHFRTSGMKTRVVARFRDRLDIDMSRCWNVISHILATALGASLFLERRTRPLLLLANDTEIPFITSDQPTANLLAGNHGDASPEHLAFYYPISPKLALLLDEPGLPSGFGNGALTASDVRALNAAVMRLSSRQVFANSEALLSEIALLAA